MTLLPGNYHGFRSADTALGDLKGLAEAPAPFHIVRVRVSTDEGSELVGTGRLSAHEGRSGVVSLVLDDTPLVMFTTHEIRGGWLSVNDDDDLSLAVDFTAGRLHIADAIGRIPTPLRSMQVRASRRVARQGVRGWPEVLHDMAAVGAEPREGPKLPVSVVVVEDHASDTPRLLSDGDDPSEASLLVGDSEALRLSAAAFRGAWLWDEGDDTYLNIDASGGIPGGHPLLTHQISTVWGLH